MGRPPHAAAAAAHGETKLCGSVHVRPSAVVGPTRSGGGARAEQAGLLASFSFFLIDFRRWAHDTA